MKTNLYSTITTSSVNKLLLFTVASVLHILAWDIP